MAGHRGAAALPLPTLQAGGGRLKPRRRLGLGFRLGVVAPPSPPSFCQFPPSSQPRKLGAILCPLTRDGFYPHKISLYGFISIFFFAGLRPEPRWGQGPQTPELGPSGPKTSS